ncbi:MAG: hypothetical protein WBV94_25145 [Blastocatellia bacterium]
MLKKKRLYAGVAVFVILGIISNAVGQGNFGSILFGIGALMVWIAFAVEDAPSRVGRALLVGDLSRREMQASRLREVASQIESGEVEVIEFDLRIPVIESLPQGNSYTYETAGVHAYRIMTREPGR